MHLNKKIFAVSVVALFLIVSIGAVSAEKSIDVKATGDLPGKVTVSLMCDGKVVETASLNSGNSWKTTFTIDDDGNYSVVVSGDSDYSFSLSGNAEKGFVVNSKQLEVLGAADSQLEEDDSADGQLEVLGAAEDVQLGIEGNDTDNNDTNDTDTNDTDDIDDTNVTEDINETVPDGVYDDPILDGVDALGDSEAPDKDVKKDKPVVKKENKTHQAKLRHTGFPLVVLVVAVFAAIFIPINRKK